MKSKAIRDLAAENDDVVNLLQDFQRVLAENVVQIAPAIEQFLCKPNESALGFVVRGFDETTREHDPDPVSPGLSRCPSVTCHYLQMLLAVGVTSVWDLCRVLEESGFKINSSYGANVRGLTSVDHVALRLLLTDDEIKACFRTDSGADHVARDVLSKHTAGSFSPTDGAARWNACEVWWKQLFQASTQSDADSPMVLLGSLIPALAEWHRRHVGLRGGDEQAIVSQCLDVAEQRLFYLLWVISEPNSDFSTNWNKSPQSHAYGALAVKHAGKLASSLKAHSTIGNLARPVDWSSFSSGTPSNLSTGILIEDSSAVNQLLEARISDWCRRTGLAISEAARTNCQKYEREGTPNHMSTVFYYLAWVVKSPEEARSVRSHGDRVLELIYNNVRPSNAEDSPKWGPDPSVVSPKSQHTVPASSELALAFLAAAAWPCPGAGLLSSDERKRYSMAVEIAVHTLRGLETDRQRVYSRDRGSTFVISYGPSTVHRGSSHPSAWETLLALRLALLGHSLGRALVRDRILKRYDAVAEVLDSDRALAAVGVENWQDEVADADPHTKYSSCIFSRFIKPLVDQAVRRDPTIRPVARGVSFILYGPPGSGKTHAVDKIAATLGWPLLSLGPSDFVVGGDADIETNAAAVFGDLMQLDRCVVFFDECDELFRSRRELSGASRNSLSFATASMLPKLQALSKARRVLFVLATNYLHNIDDAVRRDGRFDERLLVDRPHSAERLAFILKRLSKLLGPIRRAIASAPPLPGGPSPASVTESVYQAQALLSLLVLRATQGYSFTQVSQVCALVCESIPASSDAVLSSGNVATIHHALEETNSNLRLDPKSSDVASQLMERSATHVKSLGGKLSVGTTTTHDVLNQLVAEAKSISAAADGLGKHVSELERAPDVERVPLRLCDAWPVQAERECYGLDGHASPASPTGEALKAIAPYGEVLNAIGAFKIRRQSPPTWPDKNVTDYIEWIVSRADSELQAASVSPDVEVMLKAYWVSIPGYHMYLRSWLSRHVQS